jgi:hypothetical protein
MLPKQPAATAIRIDKQPAQPIFEDKKQPAAGMAAPEPEPEISVVGEIFERPSMDPMPPSAPIISTKLGFPSAKHRSNLPLGRARQQISSQQQQAVALNHEVRYFLTFA